MKTTIILLTSLLLATCAWSQKDGSKKAKGKNAQACADMIVDVTAEDQGDLVQLNWEITNPCKFALSHAEFGVAADEEMITIVDSTMLSYNVEFTKAGVKYETLEQGIADGETEVFSYAVSKDLLLDNTTTSIRVKTATVVFEADVDLTDALVAANILKAEVIEVIEAPVVIEAPIVKEPVVEAPVVQEPIAVKEPVLIPEIG